MHGSVRDRFAQSRAIPDDSVAPLRGAGHPGRVRAQQRPPGGQYAFLLRAGVSGATLAIAEAEARRCDVATHRVLLSAGFVSQAAYSSALAGWLGVPVVDWAATFDFKASDAADDVNGPDLQAHFGGRSYRVLCAEDETPDVMGQWVAELQALGVNVALCSRFRLDAALEALLRAERLDHAVGSLFRDQPASSAAGPIWIWQVIAAAIAAGLIIGGFSVLPGATIAALSGIIAVPFLCVTLLRVVALREVMGTPRQDMRRLGPIAASLPQALPLYTVMVPLFREARMLSGLVQSLQALAYPRAKLEILLVLEAVDTETQAAVLAMRLPGNFRTVIVPGGAPQTKPKALNYALQFACGDYVVVYDAEDRPEPDQLLRALTAFEHGPPQLGCVQAQLNIYNPRSSWLTRGIMAQTPLEMNPCPA